MSNGAKLMKRYLKLVELLSKPSSLDRGLRKPQKEELIGPFSLLGIPDEGKFSEVVVVIGDLQKTTSADPPSFEKSSAKAPRAFRRIPKRGGGTF